MAESKRNIALKFCIFGYKTIYTKMDKEQLRKEFNDFLDSASDATVNDFLKFLKDRKAEKSEHQDTPKKGSSEDGLSFENRSN